MAISRHSAGRCAAWFQTLNLDLEPVSRYPPRCVDANTSVAAEYSIAFRTTRNASEVRAVRAILLCGAPLQPCPIRRRFTNPTPHKWEGNIRAKRSRCHALPKVASNAPRLVATVKAKGIAITARTT